MDIRVLGPLTAQFGAQGSVVPSGQQAKRVLAVLLLHANEPVTVQTLAREIWGYRLPTSATTTVQTYVLNIRKAIAHALGVSSREVARTVLRTEYGGYRFHAPPECFDLAHFQRLARNGSRVLAAGDAHACASLLATALQLWRGPVLADVTAGEVIAAHIEELNVTRLATVEQRITADLLLGRHYELLGELAALTIEHPFNESLHAQYMIAMHHTGRRSQALAAYQRLRDTLGRELGLDPMPALQDIHRTILGAEDMNQDNGSLVSQLRAIGAPLPIAA